MSDAIKRIDLLRNPYQSKENIKKVSKDDKTPSEEAPITNATGSPYLSDQSFQKKDIVFNSPEEVDWKEVKSYEETRKEAVFKNLKRLNII